MQSNLIGLESSAAACEIGTAVPKSSDGMLPHKTVGSCFEEWQIITLHKPRSRGHAWSGTVGVGSGLRTSPLPTPSLNTPGLQTRAGPCRLMPRPLPGRPGPYGGLSGAKGQAAATIRHACRNLTRQQCATRLRHACRSVHRPRHPYTARDSEGGGCPAHDAPPIDTTAQARTQLHENLAAVARPSGSSEALAGRVRGRDQRLAPASQGEEMA